MRVSNHIFAKSHLDLSERVGLSSVAFAMADEARLWQSLFSAEHACPLDWADAVAAQLSTWRGRGFSLPQLDLYCGRPNIARVQIVDGESCPRDVNVC